MNTLFITSRLAGLTLLCGAMLAPAVQAQTATAANPAPDAALYQAFGEKAGIASLVNDFVMRLTMDARISELFKKANLDNLRTQLTDQLCMLSGGPCKYSGVDMKTAHQEMDIQKQHFNALVEDLQAAMDARNIPFPQQNQMLSRLAPMHREIVAP